MGDLSVLEKSSPYDIVKNTPVSYGDYSSRMDLWRFLGRNRLVLYEIFGFDPASEPDKLKQFTLSNNIKENYPPTLLIHSKYDHLVDLQQVKEFQKFLSDKKLKSELYIVDYGHSTKLLNQNPEAIDKTVEFLKNKMQ